MVDNKAITAKNNLGVWKEKTARVIEKQVRFCLLCITRNICGTKHSYFVHRHTEF